MRIKVIRFICVFFDILSRSQGCVPGPVARALTRLYQSVGSFNLAQIKNFKIQYFLAFSSK